MQTLKITMELTLDQARALFGADGPTKAVKKATGPKVIRGRGSVPKVDNIIKYRSPNAGKFGASALTEDGMRKVWDLYHEGYSIPEIASTFQKIAHRDTIRRLIVKIQKAGK